MRIERANRKVSQINEGAFEKMSRNSGGGGGVSMTELNRKESEMTDPRAQQPSKPHIDCRSSTGRWID
jgi:hypothetical protein